ncbi:MAG: DUF421 domain-containing protein [Gemmatimonadaceae bacterium]|nr:DUF421 domain-containing protein [Gemmatimonadaceae bacterium]NUO95952.1 DUF421 domain-containing protein [Gemmatimonadaceae bacterium]NUP57346.1 DUF421 domain-containing protein [Gemmatimonadaceae bacterium]NUP70629.1 DUF421 domain-containing protein [Gemmatimonadaceae bacterium]NUR32602.1 DUF421 domain-containing protein [Gemmatimonadaceae bacterium]
MNTLFHSWSDIGRTVAVSAMAFVLIVALLRIVGPQSLAKMSGFDVVFTVTMGSVIATVAVSRDVTLAQGIAALVTMLALQEIIRRIQSRFLPVHHLVRQAPRVLLWDGTLLEDRLQGSGVSADEIRAAVRKAGLRSLDDAQIVVLENDGEWSVIAKSSQRSDESALFGLPIPGRPGQSPAAGSATATPAPVNRLP